MKVVTTKSYWVILDEDADPASFFRELSMVGGRMKKAGHSRFDVTLPNQKCGNKTFLQEISSPGSKVFERPKSSGGYT
jgi:hypothetical protein